MFPQHITNIEKNAFNFVYLASTFILCKIRTLEPNNSHVRFCPYTSFCRTTLYVFLVWSNVVTKTDIKYK